MSALAARLRASLGVEATPRELAEAVWLAGQLGRTEAGPDGPRTASPPHRPPQPTPGHSAEPPHEPHAPAGEPPDHGQLSPEPTVGARPADPADDSVRVRVPTAPTLPHPLQLQRALRPLRHYRPPVRTRAHRMDEQATAEQAAETGLLLPVLRPDAGREARLRLLMDVSTSTAVWDSTFDELRQICAGIGAFREVAMQYVHHLDDGVEDRLVVARSRSLDGAGPVRAAEQLRDPTGRQLTLVLSDCAGPLWRTGRMQRLLHHWGQAAPVAVVQPLPQRMWRRTHLPASPGVLRRREGLGARLDFEAAQEPGPVDALPVPVLSPTRAALGTWARLLAGNTGLSLPGAAAPVRADHPSAAPRPARAAPDAPALVAAFRRTASRPAVSLAVHLTAVPLTLPVMQLVQRVMQPQSGPTVLAEVLLSGLLRGDGDDWYDFVPGARDELMRLLHRGDAMLLLKLAGDYVGRHFGRKERTFPALLAVPGTAPRELPRAFAEVSARLLGRFGSEAAESVPRRETFDVVYTVSEAPWASWMAYVLGVCGCEVNLREWNTLDRESLGAVLLRSVGRGARHRVLLLVGGWYDPYEADVVETTAAQFSHRAGVIAVDVHPERSSPSYDMDLAIGLELTQLGEGMARWKLLDRLGVEQGAYAPDDVPRPDYPGPARTVRGEVPERTPGYVYSQAYMAELRRLLPVPPGACAVIGPPATGKSQLAAEYVDRHGDEYDLVWWVRGAVAESLGEFAAEFRRGAEPAALLVELSEAGLRPLIVLDDCDDFRQVSDLLITDGHFLITSRAPAWAEVTDVVRMDSSDEAELVRRALVRIDTTVPGRRGSGFFLAPGWVVTAAHLSARPSAADSQPVLDRSVTTMDGQSYSVDRSVVVDELALLHVPGAEDPDCLWLTDQPYASFEAVTLYTVDSSSDGLYMAFGRGTIIGSGTELPVLDGPASSITQGGPAVASPDRAVVAVVGQGRRLVPLTSMWELGTAPGSGSALWQEIVGAHDRHHADRYRQRGPNMTWTGVQTRLAESSSGAADLSPVERVELFALLAELPPPQGAHEIEALVGERDPATPLCSWRDGVGRRREPALLYAARVCKHVVWRSAVDSTVPGVTEALRTWITRNAQSLNEGPRRRVLEVLAEVFREEDVSSVAVLISSHFDNRYSWLSNTRVDRSHRGLSRDALEAELRAYLAEVLPGAEDGLARHVVFMPPSELLWELPVETWRLWGETAAPLGARHHAYVMTAPHGSDARPDEWWSRHRASSKPFSAMRLDNGVHRRGLLTRGRWASFSTTGVVPVGCRHAGSQALDEARSSGCPLILWDRGAGADTDCAEFFKGVEGLLSSTRRADELLDRVRELRARIAADPTDERAAWARHLAVYYSSPRPRAS
ncbi:SAV_2336 N-terminal domain-related protein [Streptomyces sp. NPDC019531]|uniref:SAV_2336 N-terminal domain-related protein n=1 Tax=Streptomyces sp. NPDC019531 TaxID=3365062 RepID=UPI00384EBEA1